MLLAVKRERERDICGVYLSSMVTGDVRRPPELESGVAASNPIRVGIVLVLIRGLR